MTFEASQPRNDSMIDDSSRERCLRYLLGELETAEAVAFEQELCRSPAINEELLRQADLLCDLSASINQGELEPVLVGQHKSQLPRLVAIAALAACLLIIVGGLRTLNRDQSVASVDRGTSSPSVTADADVTDASVSEASLIAQAWATSRMDGVVIEDDLAAHEFEYEFVSTTEDVVGEDSAFSWMVHAIAADPDSPTEAATSDG